MNQNYSENELSRIILDTCFYVHRKLGPGLFESVYEEILNYEFLKQGLVVDRQEPIPVIWKDITIRQAFRADLIIEKKVIIEIKSVDILSPVQKATNNLFVSHRTKTWITYQL